MINGSNQFNQFYCGHCHLCMLRSSKMCIRDSDALRDQYGDMLTAGIVDPTKVTRSALQNAASVASMVLTTESLVADKKEETPAAPAMDPSMGGMY